MTPLPRNPTLADVARRVGVIVATVNMELREDVRISAPTRERVKAAATLMNYRPDPLLSALVQRRRGGRAMANVGLIVDERWERAGFPLGWEQDFVAGLKAGAVRHGYGLDILRRGADLNTRRDPDRLLRARGIRGLILAPCMPAAPQLRLSMEDYTWLKFGHPPETQDFHRTGPDTFAGTSLVCAQLRLRGVRRVGLAEHHDTERRRRFASLGALTKESALGNGELTCVTPYLPEQMQPESFLRWVKRERPQVVLSNDARVISWLTAAGITVPERIGVVLLSRDFAGFPNAAGISQHFRECGESAIEFLHTLLIRGERGVPAVGRELLVMPHWVEGGTLKDKK